MSTKADHPTSRDEGWRCTGSWGWLAALVDGHGAADRIAPAVLERELEHSVTTDDADVVHGITWATENIVAVRAGVDLLVGSGAVAGFAHSHQAVDAHAVADLVENHDQVVTVGASPQLDAGIAHDLGDCFWWMHLDSHALVDHEEAVSIAGQLHDAVGMPDFHKQTFFSFSFHSSHSFALSGG